MAGEIKRNITLTWSKGGAEIIGKVTEVIDQVGLPAIMNIQIIGNASETLDFGDVTDAGNLLFKNLTPAAPSTFSADEKAAYIAANTIHVGNVDPVTADNASHSLPPQGGASHPTNVPAWYAKAVTAGLALEVIAIQK